MSFHATATKNGHSKGLRLDAALYREHPEFASGTFEVDVIAPGRMLVRAQATTADGADADPIFGAFLAFMEQSMATNPGALMPLRADDVARAAALVAGMTVDETEAFPDDFELP